MKVCKGTLRPVDGTCRDCEEYKECLAIYYNLNGMK